MGFPYETSVILARRSLTKKNTNAFVRTRQQIALGNDYAGMWSSDDKLAQELKDVRKKKPIPLVYARVCAMVSGKINAVRC